MKKTFLIAACVLLISCTSYERVWVKPDASRDQRKHQEAACEAQALKALPPNKVMTSSITKDLKNTQGPTSCATINANCGGTKTDYIYTDTNRAQRGSMIKDCMYKNGWTRTKVERPLIKW